MTISVENKRRRLFLILIWRGIWSVKFTFRGGYLGDIFRIICLRGYIFCIIYLKGVSTGLILRSVDFYSTYLFIYLFIVLTIFPTKLVIHRVWLAENDGHAIKNSVWNIAYNLVQLFKSSAFSGRKPELRQSISENLQNIKKLKRNFSAKMSTF